MKVVDRNAFLKLPPGTVYAKFGGESPEQRVYDIGELCIKADRRGQNDWYATSLACLPEYRNDNEFIDVCDRLEAGEEMTPDFDSSVDDGLYDEGQLFAVYSDDDVAALIDRLQRARVEANADAAVSA